MSCMISKLLVLCKRIGMLNLRFELDLEVYTLTLLLTFSYACSVGVYLGVYVNSLVLVVLISGLQMNQLDDPNIFLHVGLHSNPSLRPCGGWSPPWIWRRTTWTKPPRARWPRISEWQQGAKYTLLVEWKNQKYIAKVNSYGNFGLCVEFAN